MDLRFPHDYSRHQSTIDKNALETLQSTSHLWAQQIGEFLGIRFKSPTPDDPVPLINEIHVNGVRLSSYFDTDLLLDLFKAVKLGMTLVSEGKSLLEDVIGILSMIAVLCNNFADWVQSDNAEESWQKLMKSANLLVESARSSYDKHKEIYDNIFHHICKLLPGGIAFCVQLASTLIASIYKYRHSIAEWIAANWKEVAVGFAIGAVALAVAGFVGYGVYKAASGSSDTKDKKKKKSET